MTLALKVQFPSPDREGGDKNKDSIHCSALLAAASYIVFSFYFLKICEIRG